MTAALTTEFLKLRRSKVTWATLGAFSIVPAAIALFMWIVREPGRAAQLGLRRRTCRGSRPHGRRS